MSALGTATTGNRARDLLVGADAGCDHASMTATPDADAGAVVRRCLATDAGLNSNEAELRRPLAPHPGVVEHGNSVTSRGTAGGLERTPSGCRADRALPRDQVFEVHLAAQRAGSSPSAVAATH
jgi:hypothetical protein